MSGKRITKKVLSFVMAIAMVLSLLPSVILTALAATTLTGLQDENIGITYVASRLSSYSIKADGTIVTGEATGKKAASELRINVTNNRAEEAVFSFDYIVSDYTNVEVKIGDLGGSARVYTDGHAEVTLAAGKNFTPFAVQGASPVTFTLSNIRLSVKGSATITFQPASDGGSYTVDGATITENTEKSGDNVSYSLVATAADGYEFQDWYDVTNENVLSTNASFAYSGSADCTITARFVAKTWYNTAFQAAENGTYSVNGTAIESEQTIKIDKSVPCTLVATPADGYQFYGWYNETTGKYVATTATATVSITEDCTIVPQFVKSGTGIYETGGQVFTDLNQAITYAQANSATTITMLADDTLTGSCTIPSGITLLIPNDSTNTLYTAEPEDAAKHEDKGEKKAYRTLTLADGASIDVQGAISVGGTYYAPGGSERGYMTGGYGLISMGSNSTITVESGGKLYAWGYISGSGSVIVKNGGYAYEWFQVMDFRGGGATLDFYLMQDKMVFPFNQYYIQNVEVPMTLEAGASESTYVALYANSKVNGTTINLVGKKGLFNVTSGSLTKEYDGSKDRQKYTINGNCELNSFSLKVVASVKSADYVLPIPNNVSLNIASGTFTVKEDVSLLPGAEVTIDKDASMVVAQDAHLYVYDADDWGDYSWNGTNTKFVSLVYAPSKAYTRSASDLKDAMIDVNGTLTAEGSIYTTKNGANICSSKATGQYIQKVENDSDGFLVQATQSSNSITDWPEIEITSAQLKNAEAAEEEYYATDWIADETTVYYFLDHWTENKPITITYDANGGEGSMDSKTIESYTEITLSANTFTRDGYTFSGWNTAADGTGTTYANEVTVKLTEDTTLYAQWSCQHQNTELKNQKDATCTEEGYTGDRVCTTCGETVEAGTAIDAKGHTWDGGEVTTPAECEKPGVMTYTCTVCKATKNEEIKATGHTEERVAYKAPTCTEVGHTAGTKCSVCGEILDGVTELSMIEHSWNSGEVTTSAGCTTKGVMTYTCSVCSETKTADIDATGHKYGEVTYTWSDDNSTCTATRTCSVCATKDTETVNSVAKVTQQADCEKPELTTYTATFENSAFAKQTKSDVKTGEATGHSYDEGKVTTEPTCTEPGVRTYTCTRGDNSYTEAISATGHTVVAVEAKAATCTEPGYTAGTKCSVCGVTLSGLETIEATGHTYDEGKVTTEPTCTTDGVKTFTCVKGDDSYTKTIDKLGHSYDEGKVTTEPTCTEPGVRTYTCTRGDNSYTEAIPATGHTVEAVEAKAATCTEDGYTAGTRCSVCKVTLSGLETIEATGHTYDEGKVTTEPTCTTDGVKTFTCVKGDDSYTKTIDKLGHSYDEGKVTTEPTCTEPGVRTYTCTRGDNSYTEAIPATGHTVVTVEAKAATCTEPGYTEGTKCSVCGAIISDLTEIPATGHDWDEGRITTEPTCTKTGVETYTCKNGCGGTKTETVPATDHTPVVKDAKEATVTEDGYTGDTYCSVCGEKLATGTAIPKTGAKIAQGTVTGGELTVPTEATYGGTVTITAKADSGYYLLKQPVVTTESGAAVEVTKADDGTYTFTMPKENVTISASFIHLFDDVQDPASWYFTPVYWAVDKGITVGTGDNLFSPGMECTRAQIVTFLWNAAGQPEPTTDNNPFTDVDPSAWYYKAVQWAVENKVTAGTSETTFSPDMKCSRAQIVTFLWNYAGKPAATQGVSFTDVSESAWYYTAVQWAVENKITAGTGDNQFSPDAICTRSQAVTFLYNNLAK